MRGARTLLAMICIIMQPASVCWERACSWRAHRQCVALQLEQRVAALVVHIQQAGVQQDAALRIRCSRAAGQRVGRCV
jgi:hypothetical protein